MLAHPVKQILSIDIALRGGAFQPAQGFLFILRDLPTLQVQLAEGVLGIRIALFRRLPKPSDSGIRILLDALPVQAEFSEPVHRMIVTSIGGNLQLTEFCLCDSGGLLRHVIFKGEDAEADVFGLSDHHVLDRTKLLLLGEWKMLAGLVLIVRFQLVPQLVLYVVVGSYLRLLCQLIHDTVHDSFNLFWQKPILLLTFD